MPESYLSVVQDRAALAEECVRRLLNTISPSLLTKHAGDWKTATDEVCEGD